MQQTYAAVQRDLLEANHLSPDLLAQSLSIIGANHVDYADIYCQRTAYESWHLEEGIVKSGSFQIDQGVGVRRRGQRQSADTCLRQTCPHGD